MRILFCNYEYPPLGGGGGVVMAALARELARRHEVTVLTSRALDLPAARVEHGVRVLRVPVFFRHQLAVANFASMLAYLPMAILRGLALRHADAIDVINTHFVVPTGPAGHVLARWHNVPNVLSLHGGDLFDPSKRSSPHRQSWLRGPIRRLLSAADRVVCQSHDTLRHVKEIYDIDRPLDLIPLGIERPPSFNRVSRDHFNLPSDAFVIVTVGRLVARKRTVQLIHALRDMQRPNAHLLIVGEGPERAAICEAAATLGVSERVHLLGQVEHEEKYRALSVADIFASTSEHEGFGLVFLEAMAFGLPIVCFDRGGQTDFLATGTTGHVVRLNDFEAFARSLAALHDDPVRRDETGRRNRMMVENFFIDRCAEQYEAVFASVQEARPQGLARPVERRP